MNYFNCDCCGRFIANREFQKGGGASELFVPDSDVSSEEIAHRCKKCTEKHGKPVASQNVVQDIVSVIY